MKDYFEQYEQLCKDAADGSVDAEWFNDLHARAAALKPVNIFKAIIALAWKDTDPNDLFGMPEELEEWKKWDAYEIEVEA